MTHQEQIDTVLQLVQRELTSACAKFPPFHSAHEGYGVIVEELKELEEHVFMNQLKRDTHRMADESIQLAAMALRMVIDCCNSTEAKRIENYRINSQPETHGTA